MLIFFFPKPFHPQSTQHVLLANQTNQLIQIRTKMVDHRMVRDHKKRKTVEEYGPERFRVNMVRKSKIIPQEIKVSYQLLAIRKLLKN